MTPVNLERLRYLEQVMQETDWSYEHLAGDASLEEVKGLLERLRLALNRFGGPLVVNPMWGASPLERLEDLLVQAKRERALLCLELARWDLHGPYLGLQGAQEGRCWVVERASQLMDLSFEELGRLVARGPSLRVDR